jgi:peptidoglycan hydrolase-like protein with peptidoglycan-binding domain
MGVLDVYKQGNMFLPEEFVYTSLDEVPPDTYDPILYPDGDNSVLALYEAEGGIPLSDQQRVEQAQRNADANIRLMLNRKNVVPLPRNLYYKTLMMQGGDVLALQRALASAGFRKWGNFTRAFGKGTRKNVMEFQESRHMKTDGIYDLDVHKKLARYYDQYGTFLMSKANKVYNTSPRAVIVSFATFGYNNRYKIHYTQSGLRMYGVRNKIRPPKIPYYEDCSSFSTWTYWGAGVPDPNGLGYNGWGYTGTLAQHGNRTTNPQPGDLALYGYGAPYHHVVVYIGNGMCISHGSEVGPLLLPVHYRSDFSHFRTYIK